MTGFLRKVNKDLPVRPGSQGSLRKHASYIDGRRAYRRHQNEFLHSVTFCFHIFRIRL